MILHKWTEEWIDTYETKTALRNVLIKCNARRSQAYTMQDKVWHDHRLE